ncbi:hypothetical protein OAQ99_05720 [Candidatus Kapabacteria bacterium]|nr:hypothetical protein [Candidatus Kapabacteria bacterium]
MFAKFKELFVNSSQKINEALSSNELKDLSGNLLKINRWSVFIFLILSSSMMIFYVRNVSQSIELSGDILNLKKEKQILDNRLNVLNTGIIELSSASRICGIAEEKLKMIKSEIAPKTIEYE